MRLHHIFFSTFFAIQFKGLWLKFEITYNNFCWKNSRQSVWTKHFLRGQVQVSSDAQDLYQLRMKCFLDRKQCWVKMHHGWSGGGLRFYRVRDSTYFSEFVKIFHIISPSGAEYCSQANYKGADPSCVQGWTSRFNFVVGIISSRFIERVLIVIRLISGKGWPDSMYPQCQEGWVLRLRHLDLQGDVLERGWLGWGHPVPFHLQGGQPHVQNLLWRGHSWGRYVQMQIFNTFYSIFYFRQTPRIHLWAWVWRGGKCYW